MPSSLSAYSQKFTVSSIDLKCGVPRHQSCLWLRGSSCTVEGTTQQRYPRRDHRFNSCSSWAAIRVGKNKSARLETTSGVRQGCILAPALFCVAIDWILNHMTMRPGINIGSSSFSDLVYAADTAFFVKDATNATDCLSNSSSVFGLHTLWPKTKLQSVGSDSGPDLLNVVVDGNPVDLVESFTYQTSDRYCRSEITRRIGLASSAMSSLNNIPIKDDTVAENWAKN